MRPYGASFSKEEIAIGQTLVTDEHTLWSEFISELSRFGSVQEDGEEGGGVKFVAKYETSARTFLISPQRLREVLVLAQALEIHAGNRPNPLDHLPQWLIDDLWEMIGSYEEPFDEPYVTIADDGRLEVSATARD